MAHFYQPNEINAVEDASSTNSETSLPWYHRLYQQRDPWFRVLRGHWARYLTSAVLLSVQGALIACRFLLLHPGNRVPVAIVCWVLATVHFAWHWILVPKLPPWFSKEDGAPIYDSDDDR